MEHQLQTLPHMAGALQTHSPSHSRTVAGAASAGITPPNVPMPVPERTPPLPPEMPGVKEPLGMPAPTENPIPMREPPTTLPPQF